MTHGWPDSHVVWDGVVPQLADRFRIVRFDNRGVGKSSVPKPVSAYTIAKMADDFAAVIAAVSPGEPVHVLGHDWGSVSVWEYLTRTGASDRVASFTSVSGPGMAQYGGHIFDSLKRPYRPVRFARAVDRLLRLTYWYPFAVPVVAPAVFKGLMRARSNRLLTDRVPAAQRHRSKTAAADLVNTLKIYRALAIAAPTKFPADRICHRSGAIDRRHKGPLRPAARFRRFLPLGAAAVASRHHCRPLVTHVASAGDGHGRRRTRRLPGRQAGQPVAVAGAGRSQARRLRRHAGVGHRRGQRHRQGDRAGVLPRGRRGDCQRYRRGECQAHRRTDRRTRRCRSPVCARRCGRRGRRAVRRPGVRRARCARHRREQRRHRPGGRVPRHTRRAVGTGARRQPRRCRQRLQGFWQASRRARLRRIHRQRCLDGVVLAARSR